MSKYIFIAGGVMSGIGKGITTASIGRILLSKGFRVTALKIDPYINVDAGTMNPIEHGEIFVTDDGTECDQDLGNYERFLDQDLGTCNYITTGRLYQAVIERERNLAFGGRCVEVVPDIPNEVIRRIKKASRKKRADFCLIEIGGTVGEYQNLLFLEAARMMRLQHPRDVVFVLVSYLPIPKMIGEMKTKPTQHAVRTLNMAGIQPDIIVARANVPLDVPRKRKISIFCNISEKDVISAPDIRSIYEIPINFEKDNLGDRILRKAGLSSRKSDLKKWANLVKLIKKPKKRVKIGMVGKYFKSGKFTLKDSYISVIEAINHASYFFKAQPEISWLDAEAYEKQPKQLAKLAGFDGIIVPGGFGSRGVEGKIKAIGFCRRNKIPYLGLCLGMQLAVVEFARSVCRIKKANSAEFAKACHQKVIDVMPEQKGLLRERRYGGTMRLGAYPCQLTEGTLSHRAYATTPNLRSKFGGRIIVFERHRHRYELNNEFREILQKKGMIMAGVNPDRGLVEIIELSNHPFFVATQFHPEFKSRPFRPHPLFREFIRACLK